MGTEARQIPNSNVKRNTALNNAFDQYTLLGASSFLSADTKTKLTTNQPLYKTAYNDWFTKSNTDVINSAAHEVAAAKLKRTCARFIKVFALAVEDEEFPVGNFQFYHLDSNGNVPAMDTYSQIADVAANLISGEVARVAAGGAAMSMPAIAKIIALNNTFTATKNAKNSSVSALTAASNTLNGLNAVADDTILFVWNEVETHFSNLPHAALRVQGRLWGIVYVRVGVSKIVSGTVKNSVTGDVILGADVYFENGNNNGISDASGYKFTTTLMDVQKLIATHPLFTDFSVDVTLVEGQNATVDISMVPLP